MNNFEDIFNDGNNNENDIMDFDFDDSELLDFNAFEKVSKITAGDKEYWEKKNENMITVEFWNDYYRKYYGMYGFNEFPEAFFNNDENIAYYPNLGTNGCDYSKTNNVNGKILCEEL